MYMYTKYMYLNLVDNAFIIQTLAVMNPYVLAIFVLFAMLVPHRRETGHTDRGRGGLGVEGCHTTVCICSSLMT